MLFSIVIIHNVEVLEGNKGIVIVCVGLMFNYSQLGESITITFGITPKDIIIIVQSELDTTQSTVKDTLFIDFTKAKSWFGGINEYVCIHVCVYVSVYICSYA